MPYQEFSCQRGGRDIIEQYGQRFFHHYGDTQSGEQIKAPPDDSATGFERVTTAHLRDSSKLYLAVLPRGRSGPTQGPVAVQLTHKMLQRCSGSGSGALCAGFTRRDIIGQLADCSEHAGKTLILVTFYQWCRFGERWHPLLQYPLNTLAPEYKRSTECLGQLGSGDPEGAVVLINPRLNFECRVRSCLGL